MKNNQKFVEVPMFAEENGQIVANPLFHRSYDKLHSRCIEYPFAASRLKDDIRILDVGTAKADKYWIKWLESLDSREVYGLDFEKPEKPFRNITFIQADVRKLPFDDNYFDKIFAVSVVEHIGLSDPQVYKRNIPEIQDSGDVEAVRELKRILKPGGELVMTFPYGVRDGLMRSRQARTYDENTLKKFNSVINPKEQYYYEYQFSNNQKLCKEKTTIVDSFADKIKKLSFLQNSKRAFGSSKHIFFEGAVVWRKIDIANAQALNINHVEGVLCGVWRK